MILESHIVNDYLPPRGGHHLLWRRHLHLLCRHLQLRGHHLQLASLCLHSVVAIRTMLDVSLEQNIVPDSIVEVAHHLKPPLALR